MKEEQVRPLFDEVRKQRDERRGCPDCHYNTGPNWHHCDEYKAIYEANKGHTMQEIMQMRKLLSDHQDNCENCYVESHWKEFESYCEKCEELSERFYIYAHRLDHLAAKRAHAAFEQANGRPPATKLEFVEWQYESGYVWE
jgi:hypothetical protein